jgi:hypothetical protein
MDLIRTWRVTALNRPCGFLSIAGGFSSAVEAAEWADANRPIDDWRRIEILSNQRHSSLSDTDYMRKLELENKHLRAIVSELDKTADGVLITPKTPLWQAVHGITNPWRSSHGAHQNPDLQVYSTKEAARKAEL